jgi:hypothetical protein
MPPTTEERLLKLLNHKHFTSILVCQLNYDLEHKDGDDR